MSSDYKREWERKRSIIAYLIQMATVDGNIAPQESRFIADVATSIGLSSDDILDVVRNPENFVLVSPVDEHARMEILYYLLFTMRVDGVIDSKEEVLCHKAALKLGFNELLSQDLINVMKTYATKEIPQNIMLDLIKKYLN